ncbi:hypothetical protein FOMPIDRAFT_1027249 [Fomitopsis schrenkii]|uniref:Myb-like domain-containing protein n=1 Tax=Fomitopsis schrenkii TaxID=2126942 RepID=S8EKI2_FOMSC|nr:hypothetical protein FOMPIDRAFT_1027249 [Fomitopsis schrenkii]
MDNPQYYQPLSHALHPPLVAANHSPQQPQYAAYGTHTQPSVSNGVGHANREEEEEDEDDEEEVVEEELDRNEHDSRHPATSSPQQSTQASSAAPAASNASNRQEVVLQIHSQSGTDADESAKRKPGRPRGSRNRKPKTSSSTFSAVTTPAPKPPPNTYHPGFYQYPPAPGSNVNPNQQFYEFQWRALNLCSEFYNAAEELVKAASPIVIAQCYQMGPGARVDPLAMIAEAKRVCDNLPVPSSYGYPSSYTAPYAPPPAPPASTPSSSSTPASGSVITNPQSFVMPLGTSMPPPAHAAPNPYYSGVYAAARYPTAPYYSYHTPPSAPYYPPPPTAPASTSANATSPPPAPVAAAPASSASYSSAQPSTSTLSPAVSQQGTWSPEEEERLKQLAEKSRDQGGPQNKGEIEWDWVVQQWGNTRSRHQILLKATALGLKESSTRTNKRKREVDTGATEGNDRAPTPASHAAANAASAAPPTAQTHAPQVQPSHTQQTHAQAAHTHPAHVQPAHTQPMHALTQPSHSQPTHTQPTHTQQTHSQPTHAQLTHSQPTHSQPTHSQQAHMQTLHSQPTHGQTTIAPSATTTTPVSAHASPAIPPQRPPSSTTTPTTIAPSRTTTNPSPATTSSMPWSMPIVAANTPSPVLASARIEQQRSSYYRPPPTQRPSYGTSAGASTTTSYAAASANNTAPYGTPATSRPTSSHDNVAASHLYMYRPDENGTGRRDGV